MEILRRKLKVFTGAVQLTEELRDKSRFRVRAKCWTPGWQRMGPVWIAVRRVCYLFHWLTRTGSTPTDGRLQGGPLVLFGNQVRRRLSSRLFSWTLGFGCLLVVVVCLVVNGVMVGARLQESDARLRMVIRKAKAVGHGALVQAVAGRWIGERRGSWILVLSVLWWLCRIWQRYVTYMRTTVFWWLSVSDITRLLPLTDSISRLHQWHFDWSKFKLEPFRGWHTCVLQE